MLFYFVGVPMQVASSQKVGPTANAFYGKLSRSLRAELKPQLEMVNLPAGRTLYASGDQVTDLIFPLTCALTLVHVSEDGLSTLVAFVGAEGMIGLPAFMSGSVASLNSQVCIPGIAMRLSVQTLQSWFRSDPEVQGIVLGYIRAVMREMVATAHCNRHHTTAEQLSTLVLRVRDKQGVGDLFMTHDQLARMLGMRRETVSHAARALQMRGALDYRRGRIQIMDRAALESIACGCHQNVRRVYQETHNVGAHPSGGDHS